MTDLIENNREFFTSYRVSFTVKNPVPVNIVIDSLRAHERLIKRSGKFLESVYDGLHITATTVYVEEIVDGSWVVEFLVKYVVGEENEEQFRQLVENVLGDNQKMRTAVAVGVGALLSAGAISAYNASTSDGAIQPAIEAHNSVVIQAAGDINIPEEKVQEFIESNKNNKQVTRDTLDALKPASVTSGSTMEVQGIPVSLTMSSDAIEALPADMSFIPPNEQDKTYDNMDIYISASDEDSGKKGWGGLVPDLFNSRVKFVLDENVDPKNLHGKRKVNASITVHEVYNANTNKYETKSVTINEINI